jgi:HSP20 family protein
MRGIVPFNRNRPIVRPTGFEDFYNLVDDFFGDELMPRRNLLKDTFKIDVQETENQYVLEAELPGVKKEEISLELDDGMLSISVERVENVEEEKKHYIHKERRYSSMRRSINLSDAKADGIKAKLEDGVLKVTVEKKQRSAESLKIDIE